MANNNKPITETRPNWFKRQWQRLQRSWSEFRKVTWPTFPEVVKNTGVVLLVVLFFALVIGLSDLGLGALLKLITGV